MNRVKQSSSQAQMMEGIPIDFQNSKNISKKNHRLVRDQRLTGKKFMNFDFDFCHHLALIRSCG